MSSSNRSATTDEPKQESTQERHNTLLPRFRLLTVVVSVIVFGIFIGIYSLFTSVSGIEFNTRNWELRRFSFHRDPFTNFQWTGVTYDAPTSFLTWIPQRSRLAAAIDPAIGKHLPKARYQGSKQAREDWDLVTLGSFSPYPPAHILVDILTASNSDYDAFWVIWSKEHPQKAALLWPAVSDLVRFKRYAHLPEIFELAIADLTLARFQSLLAPVVYKELKAHEVQLLAEDQVDLADRVSRISAEYGSKQQK